MVDHVKSDVVAFSLDPIYGFRVNDDINGDRT